MSYIRLMEQKNELARETIDQKVEIMELKQAIKKRDITIEKLIKVLEENNICPLDYQLPSK